MADGHPHKRSKSEKSEQFAVLSDLVEVRRLATASYDKKLTKEFRERLQRMANGTAVDVNLPKSQHDYGPEPRKLIDAGELMLSDVHREMQKLEHQWQAADAAKTKLARDAETMRKVFEIERRFMEDGEDFYRGILD